METLASSGSVNWPARQGARIAPPLEWGSQGADRLDFRDAAKLSLSHSFIWSVPLLLARVRCRRLAASRFKAAAAAPVALVASGMQLPLAFRRVAAAAG